MFKKSSFHSCVTGLLLASVFNFSAFADVVPIKDSELTMNAELSKDIHQTLGYLNARNYFPIEINDEYSARTLDGYLKILDPNKVYFTQTDIEKFNVYRYKLDDLMIRRDAEIAFDIFKVYRQRMTQRTALIMSLIKSDFDFTVDESINIDRDSFTWAANEAEIKEKWRKR